MKSILSAYFLLWDKMSKIKCKWQTLIWGIIFYPHDQDVILFTFRKENGIFIWARGSRGGSFCPVVHRNFLHNYKCIELNDAQNYSRQNWFKIECTFILWVYNSYLILPQIHYRVFFFFGNEIYRFYILNVPFQILIKANLAAEYW